MSRLEQQLGTTVQGICHRKLYGVPAANEDLAILLLAPREADGQLQLVLLPGREPRESEVTPVSVVLAVERHGGSVWQVQHQTALIFLDRLIGGQRRGLRAQGQPQNQERE
jgi:hypothetical protein